METIIIIIGKIKVFLVGFFAGLVLHHFELKISNTKFNVGKFIWAGTIFGLLTVFGQWVVTGWLNEVKEEKVLVLSLMIAVITQFIIPFILKNPEKFTEFALEKIGLKIKKENQEK